MRRIEEVEIERPGLFERKMAATKCRLAEHFAKLNCIIEKGHEGVMMVRLKAVVLVVPILVVSVVEASAITAELAKKCEGLTAKQFPPRVAGNPAAGSAKGSVQDQRAYYQKCVDNNGSVGESDASKSK